jgi:ribosomal protein L40E
MRRGRPAPDQEGLQRVLLLGGVLVGLAGVAVTAWGLATEGWELVGGPVLIAFAATCLFASKDDGKGRWCPECVARNPEDAEVCANCGHALG